MRPIFLGSITILLSLTATLLVAEWIVRLTWTPPSLQSAQQTERHPIFGWAPIPGATGQSATMEYNYAFRHTRQGLRGGELFNRAKPSGIQSRLLFLGDSFTYGNGSANDEIFVARLASAWTGTQVINAGTNGYGQAQQMAVLDTLGAALAPDLTIVMFFWNDLEDNMKKGIPQFALAEDGSVTRVDIIVPDDFDPLTTRTPAPPETNDNGRPLRRAYLYKLFKEGAKGLRRKWFGSRLRTIQTPEQLAAAWEAAHDYLALINTRTREIGSKLIIVSIPDYGLVDPAMNLKGQLKINIEIEQQLAKTCSELGIAYIDLLPELRQRQVSSEQPLYYYADRHLTPAGNAAVAQTMQTVLAPYLP